VRRTSVAVIAACVLAGGVGVPVTAIAKDKGELPPGQAKKQEEPVAAATSEPTPEPAATAAPQTLTAPEPATTATPAPSQTTKKIPPGQAKKQAASATPTPAATPEPAHAPAADPAPSTPAADPAPAAAASATPAGSRGGRTTRGSGSGKVRARRRSAVRGPTTRGSGTITAGAPTVVAGPATPPAARRHAAARRQEAAKRAAARKRPAPKATTPPLRTLTRQVERVVEVIPAPVRAVLGILAAVALLLAAALTAAAVRARRLERQRRRLTADVGLLQSALLPDLTDGGTGPATVTAAYRPAEGLAAGGDFYDAFALDEHRTAIVVGDVSGHGRDAVPLTASVRYTVRAYLEGGLGPRHVLQVAGRVLDEQMRERMVTIVVAVYDERTGLLTYASAGHPPPVVVGDEVQPVLAYASPAVGLGVPTGRRQVTVPLPPGSVACFYTDGLADVIGGGERLGLDRLADAVHALGPDEGAQELVAGIVRRSDTRPDDIAAVIVRPPADAPAVRPGRIEELEVDAADLRRDRLEGFLASFGVSDGVAEAAVRTASENIVRAGACMIAIHHDEGGATVAVEETPHVVALPLFGRDVGAAEPAVHEERRRGYEAGLI
jgi:serine phosphatase RsbU (regulator of sigma subunit)